MGDKHAYCPYKRDSKGSSVYVFVSSSNEMINGEAGWFSSHLASSEDEKLITMKQTFNICAANEFHLLALRAHKHTHARPPLLFPSVAPSLSLSLSLLNLHRRVCFTVHVCLSMSVSLKRDMSSSPRKLTQGKSNTTASANNRSLSGCVCKKDHEKNFIDLSLTEDNSSPSASLVAITNDLCTRTRFIVAQPVTFSAADPERWEGPPASVWKELGGGAFVMSNICPQESSDREVSG